MASDWAISIPLSVLAELQTLPERMKEMERKMERLQADNDSLRSQYLELLLAFRDLKKRS